MIRSVVTLLRRALGAVLLLLLLLGGAELAVRLLEIRRQQPLSVRRPSPLNSLLAPSWTVRQELRPLANIRVKAAADRPSHSVSINSYGLRGEEIEVPKPPDVYRILCLGDETVLGLRHPEQVLFGAQLKQQLQSATRLAVEVCLAGVPDACPLTEYLLLKHRWGGLEPDLVLVVVNDGDVADDLAQRRYARFDSEGVPLACRHPSLSRSQHADPVAAWRQQFRLVDLGLEWAGHRWKEESDAADALDSNSFSAAHRETAADRQAIDRCLIPVTAMAQWCRRHYAGFAVVHAAEAAADSGESVSLFTQALQHLAASQQFLLAEPAREATEPGGEWTAEEHAEFAAFVVRRMTTEMAGPWSSPYFRPDGSEVAPASYNAAVRRP